MPKRKSTATPDMDGHDESMEEGPAPKQSKPRARKVHRACVFCRRSHMTCDDQRPCTRCIKRNIADRCYDEEPRSKPGLPPKAGEPSSAVESASPPVTVNPASTILPVPAQQIGNGQVPPAPPITDWTQFQFNMYNNNPDDSLGNEFNALTAILAQLDEQTFFNATNPSAPQFQAPLPDNANLQGQPQPLLPQQAPPLHLQQPFLTQPPPNINTYGQPPPTNVPAPAPPPGPSQAPGSSSTDGHVPNILPSATPAEQFLLTAADQESGTRRERLTRVIAAKYEAGLLKPYNYVKGYARLSRWMDRNVSQDSKQAILQPLSVLRPNFRSVASSLTDMELILVEESFERLLLDYDRVFSAMGIPACLWRRTGEIYKGNREFAELVGIDGHMLREGRLCIYELMAEESAVNYWEKYGQIAFDSTQKAILTSCVLRYKPAGTTNGVSGSASPTLYRNQNQNQTQNGMAGGSGGRPNEEGFIHCTFSFTIRRDTWGIPSMIVGNFIKC